jgi:hypothetical protein
VWDTRIECGGRCAQPTTNGPVRRLDTSGGTTSSTLGSPELVWGTREIAIALLANLQRRPKCATRATQLGTHQLTARSRWVTVRGAGQVTGPGRHSRRAAHHRRQLCPRPREPANQPPHACGLQPHICHHAHERVGVQREGAPSGAHIRQPCTHARTHARMRRGFLKLGQASMSLAMAMTLVALLACAVGVAGG